MLVSDEIFPPGPPRTHERGRGQRYCLSSARSDTSSARILDNGSPGWLVLGRFRSVKVVESPAGSR
jgi:hypothetical protein